MTTSMQFVARRYDTGEVAMFEIAGGVIAQIWPVACPPEFELAALPWVAPGFVDLQINGYGGKEFCSPSLTVEDVQYIVDAVLPFGVVRLCPTLTTHSFEVLSHSARTIAAACEQFPDVARRIIGIHLEGPYISREDGPRGAHPLEHCRPPSWDEFRRLQDAADRRISLVTLSPEFDEAPQFISAAIASGVVVAIGHTAATGDQIRAAADAGARLSTHLGNGAHRMLPRHPNYIWDQLAEDRLMASLIVDGQHLPPEVVKTFVRAKGAENCILVSDLVSLAGLPPGRYTTGLCDCELLPDGRLVIAGQTQLLAGATQPINRGICNVMRFADVDLKTAVEMATLRPAELMGLPEWRLQEGTPADFVLFDHELNVIATLCDGDWLYDSDSTK